MSLTHTMTFPLKEIPAVHTCFWKDPPARRRQHERGEYACEQDGPLSEFCLLHRRKKRKMCDALIQRHVSDADASLNKMQRTFKKRRRTWPDSPNHTRPDEDCLSAKQERDEELQDPDPDSDSDAPSLEMNILDHVSITENERSTLLGLFHGEEDEQVTSPGNDPPSESQTPDELPQPSTPQSWTPHQSPRKQPVDEEDEYRKFEEWIWSSYDDLRDWMKGAPVDGIIDFNVV